MSSNFESGKLTVDLIEALVKRMGGYKAVIKFLKGELVLARPEKSWNEAGGIIKMIVVSPGVGKSFWHTRLLGGSTRVDDSALELLKSDSFIYTKGMVYEVAILKDTIFRKLYRTPLAAEGVRQDYDFEYPPLELGPILGEELSSSKLEKMGLKTIVVMHEPISTNLNYRASFFIQSDDNGGWLRAKTFDPDISLDEGVGFAYVVSSIMI